MALNRFISRSAERSLPFLKTLHGAKDFAWGPEQAAAFASLKQYLTELAVLTSPDSSLPLLLYVAASPHAVSAALVQEQTVEGVVRQCPVYYVSKVLTPSKCNMTELEKIAYAVVMSSRKLVSNPVCSPRFRASASVSVQKAAFATGVLPNIRCV